MTFTEYRKLVSEYYDLGNPEADGEELQYWLQNAQLANGQVLELGCGTGRVLIPLLREKIDIVGIDISSDMLSRCREKCQKINLIPQLYNQSMQNFDLGSNFSLIFIPDGTIALIVTEEELRIAFTNVFKHLQPGGRLIFDMETPLCAENMEHKNGIWTGDWKQSDENTTYAKRQIIKYDPNTHLRDSLLIIEKFVDGSLVGTESNRGIMRFYKFDEIFKILDDVGFIDIQGNEWLSTKQANINSGFITIVCRRPN